MFRLWDMAETQRTEWAGGISIHDSHSHPLQNRQRVGHPRDWVSHPPPFNFLLTSSPRIDTDERGISLGEYSNHTANEKRVGRGPRVLFVGLWPRHRGQSGPAALVSTVLLPTLCKSRKGWGTHVIRWATRRSGEPGQERAAVPTQACLRRSRPAVASEIG